jgi:hypothetical protein
MKKRAARRRRYLFKSHLSRYNAKKRLQNRLKVAAAAADDDDEMKMNTLFAGSR